MKTKQDYSQLSVAQQWGLIILRIIIGWHFFYEGIIKLMDAEWSAESFLMNARFLYDVFQWMASHPAVLEVVNFLNVWGLILIGLGLFLGIFARTAVYAGIFILFFYYIAYLPIDRLTFNIPREGSYLLFDKTFIELMSLVVLALFPGILNIGLWGLLKKMKFWLRNPFPKIKQNHEANINTVENSKNRREMLKHLVFLPFIGGFTWAFLYNRKFNSQMGQDAITGSTITINKQPLSKLEGEIPQGNLGGSRPVSRLIMGCNLITGGAHARDLVYVSQLFKAYNSQEKIFETFILAEKAGINTINVDNLEQLSFINRYKKLFGSNLQTMIQARITKMDLYSYIDRAIDLGVDYIQIHGAVGDRFTRDGEADLLQKCVTHTKRQGYPVGLGAHDIQTFYECDKIGLEVDFYFKTMHHDQYWSATPKEHRAPYGAVGPRNSPSYYHDNMWDWFPEETVKYVQKVKKPVIGFKVLAAGAIPADVGFQYAFDNGADFICVGMFDFQIVEDANLAIRSIEKARDRQRPWYG